MIGSPPTLKGIGLSIEPIGSDTAKTVLHIHTMEIKMPELFGKECLEPMKVRITIEKMEE